MKTEPLPTFAIDVSPKTRLYATPRQLPVILGEFLRRESMLKTVNFALTHSEPVRVPFYALSTEPGEAQTFAGELTVARLAHIVGS